MTTLLNIFAAIGIAIFVAIILAVVGAIVLYLFALALYFRGDKTDEVCANCKYFERDRYHCRLEPDNYGIFNPGASACEYFKQKDETI